MNTWFGPPERNTLYPRKRVVLLCLLRCSRLSWSWFLLSFVWHFIPQGRTVTLWHRARQVASGWLDPYIVGHSRLEVVNDVFNDMGTSGLVVLPGEWSAVLVLHYSHIVAAYPHVLQVVTVVPAHTPGSPIMALASGALETCTPALGTCKPCCTGKSARLFFILEARDSQGTARRVAAQSPPHGEAGSEATLHVAASEPTSAGRQVLVLWDTWRCVVAHPTICLELKLVRGGIRPTGYRHNLITTNKTQACRYEVILEHNNLIINVEE
jgi:hypothetical protein